ncbi:MAG: cellulose biosynthesis protein BcsN [Propylenella sp.]
MTNALRMLAAGAALLAAGCSASTGPVAYYGAGSPSGGPAQLARPASAGAALVRLPEEAGPTLTVVERRSEEMMAQEIALKADAAAIGENKVRVTVGRLNDGDSVFSPKVAPPRSSDISAEMATEFPDVTMRISETVARNGYGPFGYATGARGRHTCLYAWQFIQRIGEGSGPLPSVFATPRSAALRIRLCRANTPKERLVEVVEQMAMAMPARGGAVYPAVVPAGSDALDAVYPAY